jgi:glyceraldehyde-3-phosphate dehydrogenase (NADP+)
MHAQPASAIAAGTAPDMFIGGAWRSTAKRTPVVHSYTGIEVATVPSATRDDVELALATAERGAAVMGALPAHERARMLNRAADLIDAAVEDLARTITLEEGKPLRESRGEAGRIAAILRLSAFEGAQARGESLPLDAHVGASGKLGFTMRVPCGVVVAITPFNYPALLVAHKIGPALAAGNAVILKPSDRTPLTALRLTRLLLEAGVPPEGLQCITGRGAELGPQLCADARVRVVSFTGSAAAGAAIHRTAGVKKLALELGSNCPVVVMGDADLAAVAKTCITGGCVNAGQVCISAQRVIVQRSAYADFVAALAREAAALVPGDPLQDATSLGPLVSLSEAERVAAWVDETVSQGARIAHGGERARALYAPTVVADVAPGMRLWRDEIFGPVLGVTPVDTLDEAIRLANDTPYGLGAGIFTRDVHQATRFARQVRSGNVQINWSPLWRADFMPYGGLKGSGIGREGPRYAVEEMTDMKTVVFHDA